MVVIFPSAHSLCQKSQPLPDLNVQDIDCSFTFFSSFSRSLWFSSNKRCLCIRFCYFSTSRRLLTAALSYSSSQLSNYSETTVSALLLARTLFLSRLLFSCLSAFPRLLQITTTITKILLVSKRHTICGKLIKDDDFSFFFLRHQRENTQIMRSLTRSPTFPERETRKPKLLRAVACARENHSKILVRPFFAVANSFRSFLLINHLHLERSTSTERQGAPNAHHPEKEQSSTLISSVENLHSFEHFAPW